MDPAAEGVAFELTPTLQPLAPFRDQITGLRSKPAFPGPGEGTGDHVRAASTFLTGVHPKKTEGPDIRAGISVDQIISSATATTPPRRQGSLVFRKIAAFWIRWSLKYPDLKGSWTRATATSSANIWTRFAIWRSASKRLKHKARKNCQRWNGLPVGFHPLLASTPE